ncbi:Tyrosine protein kinase domain containing protein [Aphelenchoides fujianensis]|nr:Tyrosine protein kinase domain containing protein [Aphelenchoides fujianensis]
MNSGPFRLSQFVQTNPKIPVTAAFFVPSKPNTTDLLSVQQVDDTSDYTPKQIKAVITMYAAHEAVVEDPVTPIIILITDFISKPFLHSYYAGLKNDLEELSFRIYAYSKSTHAYFPIPLVTEQPGDGPSTTIKPPKITEVEEVLIIVGCCVVLLIFLIVGTVVYRTKFSWMDKIDRFRAKHQEAEPQPIIEDYWELSWDLREGVEGGRENLEVDGC